MELRKREFPGLQNGDWLNELIQEGYKGLREQNKLKGVEKWKEAWEMVKKLIPSSITSIDEADNLVPHLTQSLHNWCQDFEIELQNAGNADSKYYGELIKYTKEFKSKFPDTNKLILSNMKMAQVEAYFNNKDY